MSPSSNHDRRKLYSKPIFLFDRKIEAAAATCDAPPGSNQKVNNGDPNGNPGPELCTFPDLFS